MFDPVPATADTQPLTLRGDRQLLYPHLEESQGSTDINGTTKSSSIMSSKHPASCPLDFSTARVNICDDFFRVLTFLGQELDMIHLPVSRVQPWRYTEGPTEVVRREAETMSGADTGLVHGSSMPGLPGVSSFYQQRLIKWSFSSL